ncbi:MAG: hypothetical protein ACYCS8_07860 [Acidithiobacillus sp.]|uniref:hypothetical protein n=1 Tax=Acidithiobacillus thiooxidans TaxID=930 RepID=UPI0009D96875|nr:hypothetical protein [Acidithiobacillus thiooxidans]
MTPPTQDEIRIGGGVAHFAKKSIQSAVARALAGDKRDQEMLINSRFLSAFFHYINEDLERKAALGRMKS